MSDMFNHTDHRAVAYAAEHAAETVDAPPETRAAIREIIAIGLGDKSSNIEMARRIEALGYSRDRAREIAFDEIRRANSMAALASYKAIAASGVRLRKAWHTARDGKVRDICARNEAAGPIDLDAPFPSGHQTPPAYVGCRCCVISKVLKAE